MTREPQNLVLQNLDKAYRQLTSTGNYFPDSEEAKSSFEHADTVVVDLKGLKLIKDDDEYGHFKLNPRNVKKLNSQQRLAAKRIYGPDEDNFEQNMEMFDKARILPKVFVLTPDYVKARLSDNDKKFLARASWLSNFNDDSYFSAGGRFIGNLDRLRGVRRAKNFPQETKVSEKHLADADKHVKMPKLEEVLRDLKECIPEIAISRAEAKLRDLYKKYNLL